MQKKEQFDGLQVFSLTFVNTETLDLKKLLLIQNSI